MEGLIEEGSEAIKEYGGAVRDAALIGAAQRVEHYEIAGYGTVIALAKQLAEAEHASLLDQTLNEEKATNAKLTSLAKNINQDAAGKKQADANKKRSAPKKSGAHRAA